MKRLAVLPFVALLPIACGDDTATQAADGGTTEGGTNEDTGGSGGTTGTADSMSDVGSDGSEGSTTSSDDGSEPEDLPPPPATGIQIVDVTGDQGTRVPIARGGVLVGGIERNAPLLRNRNTVIRAFYEVDPGFATRDIYGVLHLEQSDGTEETLGSFITASEVDCAGQELIDCRYQTLPASFFWHVRGDLINPETKYRIELFETKPGHENDISEKIPVFPTEGGSMPIGVEDTYAKMRVVVVPFYHDIGNHCPEAPDLHEIYGTDLDGNERTIAEFFGERLLAHNPADEVEIIVHDVVSFSGSMRGSQLLGALQELRYLDGAPPEYYYYGVARPCDGGPDFAGVAQLGGPSKAQASQRVGWGVYYSNVGSTAGTFVHEIGHEQGRRHIACNGEAGVDASYPGHPNGDTLSWGIDVINNPIKVYSPASHDYMTYCQNSWVSEWGWNKVYPWILAISSWELEDAGERDVGKRPLLVGTVFEDGISDFYVAEGWFDPALASDVHTVTFEGAQGVLGTAKAMVRRWERSEDLNVIVPLPETSATIETIAVTGPSLSVEVERKHLRAPGAGGALRL